MPMYDVICRHLHEAEIFAQINDREPPCRVCFAPTYRVLRASRRAVIGDELDYVDENLGPEPIHITSRAQRKQLMAERGLIEKIRHVDGDKHTSRWI